MGRKSKRVDKLTPREIEIMKEIATGIENDEIAKKFFISEVTVKNHVANMFSKLAIKSRYQLVVYAYQNRIVNVL